MNRMNTQRKTKACGRREEAKAGAAGSGAGSGGSMYRDLVENLDAAVFEVDVEGCVVYVSRGVEGLLGYRPRDLIGRHFGPFIHADDLERAQAAFAETLAGRPRPSDFRMLTKAGKLRWVRAITRAFRPSGGRPSGVQGILTDATEHKRLEEDLRATGGRFEKAFHSSPCLMSLSEIETGRFLDVNAQMTDFCGYPREEMLGRTSLELGIWISRKQRRKAIEFVKTSREPRAIYIDMRDRHGRMHHLLWSGVLVSVDGRACLLASSLDITAQRRAEEALRESEAKYKALVEASSDLVFVLGADDKVRYANPATLRALRLPADQVVGRPRASLFPPSVAADQLKNVRKVLATGEPLRREYNVEQEGLMKWSETQLMPLKDRNGKVEAVLGVSRDITERKRAEDELLQRWQDVLHSQRVLTMGQLAASLAHEINQPLMAILSNAQAAGRFLDADEADMRQTREILADIVADGKRAAEVIRRLRSMLGKGPLQRKALDVNAAVLGVVSLARSEATAANVAVTVHPARRLPRACADPVQIDQVVLNLILNAGQAVAGMPDKKRQVSVSTEFDAAAREVVVSVSDTGPGIAAKDLSRVFEPFYTTKPGGLGLGLPICRSIVAAHGGRIWAENNPGGGARFRFSLPVSERAAGGSGRRRPVERSSDDRHRQRI